MPQIRLIPIDDKLCGVVKHAPDEFAGTFGASLGDSTQVVQDVVKQTLALFATSPRAAEWGGFLVADPERALVIGSCGFTHGPEADGSVEIAYFTFPEFEGRGYATAMAAELLRRSRQSDSVSKVIAHTVPERNASTRILEKIGMERAGEAEDADVGKVWLWQVH
jgi:RimJ/RimL family protein N-acetyltransferase